MGIGAFASVAVTSEQEALPGALDCIPFSVHATVFKGRSRANVRLSSQDETIA
jgi:hypothetical protein